MRQKVERNKGLQNKRSTASSSQSSQQFNISTPPLSPRDTPDKLQKSYDKRLVETMAKRKPIVPKLRGTPPPETQKQDREEQLQQKRASAAQIAKKRERKKEPNTKRSRQKTPYGARQT